MIIDAHCHYFDGQSGLDFVTGSTFDEHIKDMRAAKIDKFALFTLAGLFKDFQPANDEVGAAAKRFSEQVIPFCSVNPWYEQAALDELDRCLGQLDFKGVKLHPWMTGFPVNSDMIDPIMEKIASYDVPVIIHSGTPPWSEPLQIGEVAKRHPKVRIVMAHMGIIDLWKEAIDAARANPNIWLETSGTPSAAIRVAIEEVGPERIVFGSDSPYGGNGGQLFQMNKIRYLNLGERAEELILGENLRQVLRL